MMHKWLKPIHHYTFCNTCGNPKLLHVLCGHCFKETMRKTAEYRNKMEQLQIEGREAGDREQYRLSEDIRASDEDSSIQSP